VNVWIQINARIILFRAEMISEETERYRDREKGYSDVIFQALLDGIRERNYKHTIGIASLGSLRWEGLGESTGAVSQVERKKERKYPLARH